MAVVPAPLQVDLGMARSELGAEHVNLAAESDFTDRFPDCEPGAEPPFGQLYDVPVVVDPRLFEAPEIHIRAGSHAETLRLKATDWRTLVSAREARIAVRTD